MRLNQQGQAFAGYRLIIGAMIAFFILIIIMGAINYFESVKTRTTHETLRSGLNAARETPDGSIIKKKSVYFANGTAYTKNFFSIQSGVPRECLELMADKDSPVIEVTGGGTLSFNAAVTEDVYFRCVLRELAPNYPDIIIPSDCSRELSDMFCQVSVASAFQPQ